MLISVYKMIKNHIEILDFAKSHGGYITTDNCKNFGFDPRTLQTLKNNGSLEKASYGIYKLPETALDELYIFHLRFPSIVFSHETALYLLGYSDQVPFKYNATVPVGFNSASLRQDCYVFQIKKELLTPGIVSVKTEFQNLIPVYCIERTLCDMIRRPSEFNIERFLPAIKKYMTSKEHDNIKLIKFARLFNAESKIRPYMEAVL